MLPTRQLIKEAMSRGAFQNPKYKFLMGFQPVGFEPCGMVIVLYQPSYESSWELVIL